MSDTKMLIIHETVWHSVCKDVVSVVALLGTVGIGIVVDSDALQWVGGIMWFLWMLSKAAGYSKNNVFSFEAARKQIDEWEASK